MILDGHFNPNTVSDFMYTNQFSFFGFSVLVELDTSPNQYNDSM